jgi:hypothetical protein
LLIKTNNKTMADQPTFGRYPELPLDEMTAEHPMAYDGSPSFFGWNSRKYLRLFDRKTSD